MGFVTVGRADLVPEGEVAPFDVGGVEVAIARVDGALYAVSDVCSHRRCNLANGGELEGATIVCECHGSVFDLASGAPLNPPATEPIATFGVREADGELQVDLG
ncbi:MAG TPA: Rieske 2Fe-2S domain-containing protein [Actinomycetota bacterium]|jgi:3-phenylpropionate/trans-cinnamate dioxygenase ferredoxin subunit